VTARSTRLTNPLSALEGWLTAPQSILRLEIVRALAPLAILGFMSGRMAHADELLGEAGFRVPDLLVDDYRQPLYVAALSNGAAWCVAVVLVAAGLATAAGYRTRAASLVFACALAFVALADRLGAFTVSKIAPTLMLAIFLSPAGARYGVDAWRARRADPRVEPPTEVSSGAVRYFQAFLVVMYVSSGWAKATYEWFDDPHILWSHVHDSYQTWFAWAFANAMPSFAWSVFQYVVLALELGAPIWFASARARPIALVLALGMHAMIGLMFGPVKWFALLMMIVLVAGYASDATLARAARWLDRTGS
jgi:uncharacterized membrane protein YphA (DoxX/SURF4 family)